VPWLTQGHQYLLNYAAARNDKLLVLLGVNGRYGCKRDPLDYQTRAQMVLNHYPAAIVQPIHDTPDDASWSFQLDRIFLSLFPDSIGTVYASRDGCLPHYHGELGKCLVSAADKTYSGTQARADVEPSCSYEFRAGMVHVQNTRPPTSFQTVDVAILRADETLLGRKKQDGNKWRFIGGFVDPTDRSLEYAARREVNEEAGDIEIDDITYLASFRIKDHRYRGSPDQILTAFFASTFQFGRVKAGDDVDEVAWYPLDVITKIIAPAHAPLADRLLQHTQRKPNVS
jgi:bifunctional NMN adenylyltransferase/nudix hydrolase